MPNFCTVSQSFINLRVKPQTTARTSIFLHAWNEQMTILGITKHSFPNAFRTHNHFSIVIFPDRKITVVLYSSSVCDPGWIWWPHTGNSVNAGEVSSSRELRAQTFRHWLRKPKANAFFRGLIYSSLPINISDLSDSRANFDLILLNICKLANGLGAGWCFLSLTDLLHLRE